MKKKPKKLTVTVEIYDYIVAFYALRNLTRDHLVAELKTRKIPVPKLKNAMRERLASYVWKNRIPVTVTIG